MAQISRFVIAGLFALIFAASPLWAQEDGPDYTEWEKLAVLVENVLETGTVSDSRLDKLRLDVFDWREQFLSEREDRRGRLKTRQSQLAALGPAPEEGKEEAAEISARRQQLETRIAELSAPVKQAEEAYTRADGLIREIDSLVRNRQADALLELGPTPLNPANWRPAIEDLGKSLTRSSNELENKWGSGTLRERAKSRLPFILGLIALGGLILTQGPKWVSRGQRRAKERGRYHRWLWRFSASLGKIIVPLAGIYLLTQAFLITGLSGPRWTSFLEHVPIWAGILLGIHWLAFVAFHFDDEVVVLALEPSERRLARRYSDVLASLYVLHSMLEVLIGFDNYSQASLAVVEFPLLALSGFYLYRIGTVRNDAPLAGSSEAVHDSGTFRLRLTRVLGRVSVVVGIGGPLMAAVGYLNVGTATVYPTMATLALVGVIFVFQTLINEVYKVVIGTKAEGDEGLLPVLAGFGLALLSVPLLALIWGAKTTDLIELWSKFQEGFQIGETRISPSDFLLVLVLFVFGYMLTRLIQGALRSSVLPRTKIDKGAQNAIVSGIGYIGIFLSVIIAVTLGGLDLSSLAIVAGALSVGIGFGLQNIVSNFVSGIILLIERPISEGDWIEVNGIHGTVRDISVRSTRIETFDRFDMIVPNSDLVSGTVSNYTRGNVLGRIIVPVGVAYGNDTRKVEKILLNIAREHEMVLMNPAPFVLFKGFGADSLDFEIRAILRDVNQGLGVRTEMNHQINERFAAEGIEIPFAQRDIWIRNPEALPGATETPGQIPVPDQQQDPEEGPA